MAHHRGSGRQRAAKRFRPRTAPRGLRPLRAGAQDRHGYRRPRWAEGHPDPLRLAPAVTAAIRSVDPEQPITLVSTLEALRHRQALGIDYVAVWMGVFGLLALALSSIGVYGVMAYLVSEQTHEIGIRMALGAPRENVLGMVFRRGMLTAAAGLAAGLAAAYALARLMASLVWGVAATDPATFIGIPWRWLPRPPWPSTFPRAAPCISTPSWLCAMNRS